MKNKKEQKRVKEKEKKYMILCVCAAHFNPKRCPHFSDARRWPPEFDHGSKQMEHDCPCVRVCVFVCVCVCDCMKIAGIKHTDFIYHRIYSASTGIQKFHLKLPVPAPANLALIHVVPAIVTIKVGWINGSQQVLSGTTVTDGVFWWWGH